MGPKTESPHRLSSGNSVFPLSFDSCPRSHLQPDKFQPVWGWRIMGMFHVCAKFTESFNQHSWKLDMLYFTLQPNLQRPSMRTIQPTDKHWQNPPHLPSTWQNTFQIWPNRGKKKRQIVRIKGALLCFDDLPPQLNVPQSFGFLR